MDPASILDGSARSFFVLAHRARTDGDFSLNDLCGAAGRLDGILRCINASLFLSHGMRRDTSVHALLMGDPDPPKVLSICGSEVRYLNPDERSTAALVKRALSIHLPMDPGACVVSTPGIYVTRGDLAYVLGKLQGRIYLLDEGGLDIWKLASDGILSETGANSHFFLSDDRDYTSAERISLEGASLCKFSVSPLTLHADHAISVTHNFLDRSSID
jgi:tRNA (pseudouridine54-N1)-methyltransferase